MKLWGYKRPDGSIAITAQFLGAGIFRGNLAPVQQQDRVFALVSRGGKVVERFADDTATASGVPIPAPHGPCPIGLRCWHETLVQAGDWVGGPIDRNPSFGEGHSTAGLFKFPSGAVYIDDQGYEGGITHFLLPNVTVEQAERWATTIRAGLPAMRPDGGCVFEIKASKIRGGSRLTYRHGC